MNVHVTNIYGFSPNSVTLLSQIEVRNVGRIFGFNELAVYRYDYSVEPWSELNSIQDMMGLLLVYLVGILSFFNHLLGIV